MKVRTTIRPWDELDVDDVEHAALRAQGLVLDTPAPPVVNAAAPAAATSKKEG